MLRIVFILLPLITAGAQTWPQWRGPVRSGIGVYKAPAKWPEQLKQVWAIEAGEGYGGPVADETGVCLQSRLDDRERVTCYDRPTGKQLWQDSLASPFKKNPYADKMSRSPYSTPVLAGRTLYILAGNGSVNAYDARNGTRLWSRSPQKSPDTSKMFTGTAMSPLLDLNRLIVEWGDDSGGAVVALDPASGKTLWQTSIDGPGYSSPVAATLSGIRQIIIMTMNAVLGLEAATGKQLWKIDYKDEWNENIVTPVLDGDRVIVSGVRRSTSAFRIHQAGNAWKAEQVWHNPDVAFYMSTPVLMNGRLFGLSSRKRGQLVALDAATGKTLWAGEGRFAEQAAIIGTGSTLLVATSNGELLAAPATADRLVQQGSVKIGEGAIYAHPALAGRSLFVRDAKHLRHFELP